MTTDDLLIVEVSSGPQNLLIAEAYNKDAAVETGTSLIYGNLLTARG